MVEDNFPNLRADSYLVTSPATIHYNCIAWAAGYTNRWWWPHPDAYWPPGVPEEETIEAFIKAFITEGYERCNDSKLDEGYEKIAIYATEHGPTHAARQLENGRWTSKIGDAEDITHSSLEGLIGELYGSPACYLRRLKRANYKTKKRRRNFQAIDDP